MIHDRIQQIEATIAKAPNLPAETREELTLLLAALKAEVAPLTSTHGDDADSIAQFAGVSVHEATRSEPKPELAATALKGLTDSVQGFEASHPELVRVVNRLALTLSNMGI